MSSGKCDVYTVAPDANALRLAARLEEARRSARDAQASLTQAERALRAAGLSDSEMPRYPVADGEPGTLERFAAAARVAVRRAHASIEEQRRLHRLARLAAAKAAANEASQAEAEARAEGVQDMVFDVRPSSLTDAASVEVIDAYISAVRAYVLKLQAEIERCRALAGIETIASSARKESKTAVWEDVAPSAISAPVTLVPFRVDPVETHALVERLLKGLPEPGHGDTDADIDVIVQELFDAKTKVRRDALEAQLRLIAQKRRDVATERERNRVEAVDMLTRLQDLSGEDVAALQGELKGFLDGGLPWRSNMAARVDAVAATASQRLDDEHATIVFRDLFEGLGYEVGEKFETLFEHGGEVDLRVPRRVGGDEYAVRVRVEAGKGVLHLDMTRDGEVGGAISADQSLKDSETEAAWCVDHRQIVERAKERGIVVDTLRDDPPGSRAMEVVAAPSRRRAGPAKLQEKSFNG